MKRATLTSLFVLLAILTTAAAVYADPPDSVTICHAAGLEGTTQYVTLTLPYPAVYGPAGHFNEDGTPAAGHEEDYLGPCEEEDPTDVPQPTEAPDDPLPTATEEPGPSPTPSDTPTEPPTPTPVEDCDGDCPPTATPTEPTPIEPPVTPELPSAGFTSQTEIMNGEPWIIMVNGDTTVWAAHNQEGWIASTWWQLWEGVEFEFNGQWYTVTDYIFAQPEDVHLIYNTDHALILLTCRSYDPATNTWAQRLVIYADLVEA
mgnify:CR=1 FL=1